MLVLKRKAGESIEIGSDITVKFVEWDGAAAKVGITAPSTILIRRSELNLHPRPHQTAGQNATSNTATCDWTVFDVIHRLLSSGHTIAPNGLSAGCWLINEKGFGVMHGNTFRELCTNIMESGL